MRKGKIRLLSFLTALTMLASLLPTAAWAAEGEEEAEGSLEPMIDVQTSVNGWTVSQEITITIPEGMNEETIHIDPLAGEASEDLSTAFQYGVWYPGDAAEITIKIIDESGNYYSYKDGSVEVGTKVFDFTNNAEVVYRVYNPALYALYDNSYATATKSILTDKSLAAQLAKKGYENGIEDLDDYYCDYYQVSSLSELSDDQLEELFCGNRSGSVNGDTNTWLKETNEQVAEAGWRNLYTNLFTINESGIFAYTEGSDEQTALNDSMSSITDFDGISLNVKLDGAKTKNAYQGHDIYFNLGFDLVRAKTITLTPQSITAYVGGYSQNGTHAPKLRYSVDMPEGVDVEVNDLTFAIYTITDDQEEITEFTAYSPDDSDYYLMSELGSLDQRTADTTTVLRSSYMKLVDTDANSETYAGTYQVEARTGENADWDRWYLTAEDKEGTTYLVDLNTQGVTVTIREVSDEDGMYDDIDTYVTPVVNTETQLSATYSTGTGAIALISEDTTYKTNDDESLGLLGTETVDAVQGYGDQTVTVGLLFDDTVSLNGEITAAELEGMMLTYAEEQNEDDYSQWDQQFKYLDLVNINDGNAVITSTEAVEIYWPYPDEITYETADNYEFQIIHFIGMNREQVVQTSLEADIPDLDLETLEVTPTQYGLQFATDSFSPFLLMWREKEAVAEEPAVPDDDPLPPALNTENHYAYIIGRPDGNVYPEATITRAEVATIFFRLLTEETRAAYLTTENNFTDVNEGQWFNTAISTLAAMGILKGTGNTTFEPNRPITRAELAAICARFDGGTAENTNVFSDISGHWAESEILRAADLGWVLGYTDGTFHPDQDITRAETVTMINRVLDRVPKSKADLSADMKSWPDNMDEGQWYYLPIQEATNSHDYTKVSKEIWYAITETPDWKQYEIEK
jgi:hypothetical protein